MPKPVDLTAALASDIRASGFFRHLTFVIRHSTAFVLGHAQTAGAAVPLPCAAGTFFFSHPAILAKQPVCTWNITA
jgi:hypothetical protein